MSGYHSGWTEVEKVVLHLSRSQGRAGRVSTVTGNLNLVCGILAVDTAIFAVLLRRTVAGRMGALWLSLNLRATFFGNLGFGSHLFTPLFLEMDDRFDLHTTGNSIGVRVTQRDDLVCAVHG